MAAARNFPLSCHYYVGHAMQMSVNDDSGRKELFLALCGSVDDGFEAVRTGLPVSAVFRRLRYLKPKQSVVVLDWLSTT